MESDTPSGMLSGYICPTCGGALWGQRDGHSATAYECRIGHSFTAEQLWTAHCAQRNQALMVAERSLAENAALARELAELGRALGKDSLAADLEDEAATEERYLAQVRAMLDGLQEDDGAANA